MQVETMQGTVQVWDLWADAMPDEGGAHPLKNLPNYMGTGMRVAPSSASTPPGRTALRSN